MTKTTHLSRDHHAAAEFVADLEKTCDVNRVQAGGVHLWPLIRVFLWRKLVRGEQWQNREIIPQPPAGRLARLLFALRTRFQLRRLAARRDVDALFLARVADYAERWNGKPYNRYVDPLFELLGGSGRSLKLEVRARRRAATPERAIRPFFLRHPGVDPYWAGTAVEGLEAFRGTDVPRLLEGCRLEETARMILSDREFFDRVLEVVSPKSVLVVPLEDFRNMGMLAAARRRGVPCAELQHGRQGDSHALYMHWQVIPPQGYDLLPDYFWVWSERDRKNIAARMPAGERRHQPIVGGNCWMGKWMRAGEFRPAETSAAFYSRLAAAAKVVLLTLQPVPEPLPPYVLDAMASAPPDWIWLVRLHPAQRAEIGMWESKLRERGVAQFSVREATEEPLYALFGRSHCHLTCWSTVAMEAPSFRVPTTIIHPVGRRVYAAEIEDGLFAYAENQETLLESMARTPSWEVCADARIETDPAVAKNTFAQILSSAERA